MNRYDSYKETDVPWIGEIPSHWGVEKLKYLSFPLKSGGTPSSGNSTFYTEEGGIAWVTIADMSNTEFVIDTEKHITEIGRLDKNLKIYPLGTLLYSILCDIR